MVELRVYPAEAGVIARYAVAVAWHTDDEESAWLLEQVAIRQDLALRISKQAIAYADIFERYGYPAEAAERETVQCQLRATLLDEARRLIGLALSLMEPAATAEQRRDAMKIFATHYHDLRDLQHDEHATVAEWMIKTVRSE